MATPTRTSRLLESPSGARLRTANVSRVKARRGRTTQEPANLQRRTHCQFKERFGEILSWPNLTPELRRTALRPCVSEDHSGLHEAAKRSRLERIVSALKPAVVAGRHGSLVWRGAKKCSTGRRHIGFEICRRQGESPSGKLLMALPTTALCKDLVLLRANA